jgi:phospholipid/cholesterol/gamma-HCH transport system substrate-binding protein
MPQMNAEAKVGLFVFIAIGCLVVMAMWLGGLRLGGEDGFEVLVSFPSAAGIDEDAYVAIAGVQVGRVKHITLVDNKARLTLVIRRGVRVGEDFTAVMKTSGLLGEKYVELVPGAPDAKALGDGEELTRVGTYTDIDRLIGVLEEVAVDIKGVTGALKSVLSEEGGERLGNILVNIEELTDGINKLVKTNDKKLSSVMTSMDEFFEGLSKESPSILKGLRDASDSLNEIIAENRGGLKEGVESLKVASKKLETAMENIGETLSSIQNVAGKIDRGEGTIGKLVNEPETADNINKTLIGVNKFMERADALRLFVSYRGEYLFDARDTKSYLTFKAQPRKDKFYLFEIVDDPRGYRTTDEIETTVGGVTTTERVVTTSDEFLFSAQIAKKVLGVYIRGGFIESTGGFGADYFLNNDKLKLSFDVYDFDMERNPHMRGGLSYHFGKYFLFTAGYDDFISRIGLESFYMGLGIHFEDKDLKYLLGSAPSMSF